MRWVACTTFSFVGKFYTLYGLENYFGAEIENVLNTIFLFLSMIYLSAQYSNSLNKVLFQYRNIQVILSYFFAIRLLQTKRVHFTIVMI